VPRLVRLNKDKELNPYIDDTYLDFSSRGVIDNLIFKPLQRIAPNKDEVEIEVRASGLNFRDVLNVMGMYPGDPGPLGCECAGVISAIGENVTEFKIGDEVLAESPGAFRKYVATNKHLVAKKPSNISFIEAAGIPIVYLTVHYALNKIANLKKGEKVLIHAAAGGVGLAAIDMAKFIGADIYVTVGSDAKREVMLSIGIKNNHIMNSRDTKFYDDIMELTQNQGVDVVLNSLTSKDFIQKSFDCLKTGGRFLEIGKREIWSESRAKVYREDVSYSIIAIDNLTLEEPELVGSMLNELMGHLANNDIKPIRVNQYDLDKAKEIFKFMAKGGHIGKIVFKHDVTNEVINNNTPITIKEDGYYLITGGLGGLGLKVAEWLIAKGAKNIALTSRKEPNPQVKEQLDKLGLDSNATITVISSDIANKNDVAKIFNELQIDNKAINGIIHAAGVLDDATIESQNYDKYLKVISSKILGAINIHNEVSKNKLAPEFIIYFSSATAILGNIGQANYAAANSLLDSLAFYQRQQGIRAISINWGAWAQVGMVATIVNEASQAQMELNGILAMPPSTATAAFEKVLTSTSQVEQQVVIMDVNWSRFLAQMPALDKLYSEIEIKAKKSAKSKLDLASEFIIKLVDTKEPERYEILANYIESEVKKVLGLESKAIIDRNAVFTSIGMDSLMTVEFRNRIVKTLGSSFTKALPATLMFNYPDIESLSRYLLEKIEENKGTQSVAKVIEIDRNECITIPISKPNAKCRLICFLFAGGTPEAYFKIAELFSSEIEVCIVHPFSDFYDKVIASEYNFDSMIAKIANNLHPYIKSKPFYVFGHSIGAVTSFYFYKYINNKFELKSDILFLSACSPKINIFSTNIMDDENIYSFIPADLQKELELKHDLKEKIRQRIIADVVCLSSLRVDNEKVNADIQAFGFIDDHIFSADDVLTWDNFTSQAFDLMMLKGGHFDLLNPDSLNIVMNKIERIILSKI
jgi:NADPH:quinone reductase-like Zn-dependent oxidoreductase/surfactin synthase thioesterase subunit